MKTGAGIHPLRLWITLALCANAHGEAAAPLPDQEDLSSYYCTNSRAGALIVTGTIVARLGFVLSASNYWSIFEHDNARILATSHTSDALRSSGAILNCIGIAWATGSFPHNRIDNDLSRRKTRTATTFALGTAFSVAAGVTRHALLNTGTSYEEPYLAIVVPLSLISYCFFAIPQIRNLIEFSRSRYRFKEVLLDDANQHR
jgi:hypothetical protein